MRISFGFCVILFLVFTKTNGQEYVIENKLVSDSLKETITLIPFQNNYYRSEIDRSLALAEEIEFSQLRDQLRNELDRQLYMILNDDFNVHSFLKDDREESWEQLNYIFYSTASSYTLLETDEKVNRNLLGQGQVKSAPIQEGQRYMKTLVHNPSLFETLQKEKHSDMYLFIGELDILLPETIEENKKYKKIFVHYTVYSENGDILYTGMLSQLIPSKKCDSIKEISMDGFAPIAFQLKNILTTE